VLLVHTKKYTFSLEGEDLQFVTGTVDPIITLDAAQHAVEVNLASGGKRKLAIVMAKNYLLQLLASTDGT
jgi:hypothetical protein